MMGTQRTQERPKVTKLHVNDVDILLEYIEKHRDEIDSMKIMFLKKDGTIEIVSTPMSMDVRCKLFVLDQVNTLSRMQEECELLEYER